MPFVLMLIGFVYWLNYVVRAWSVVGTDNYALVNSYSNTALLGLWLMVAGGLWLLATKR